MSEPTVSSGDLGMALALLAGTRLVGIRHTRILLDHLGTLPRPEGWDAPARAALVKWLAAWHALMQEGEAIATTLAPLLRERPEPKAQTERHDEPLRVHKN